MLALDPEHPEALHLLGAVRFQQGRLGDAEPLMRRSIEHRPVPLALANYAAVLTGAGREHDALARLDEALAISPVHQRVLFQRAGLLGQLARYERVYGLRSAARADARFCRRLREAQRHAARARSS